MDMYRYLFIDDVSLFKLRKLIENTTFCSFDIRRYCPKVSEDARWVRERSHEAYAKNYAMVFLHDEPLAGRNMKKVSDCLLDQTSDFKR